MDSSQLVYNAPHIISKILFYFKGLQTPSAIAMNKAIKKKEIIFSFKDIDDFINDFYEKDCSKEYLIINNDITYMYIALSDRPPPYNEYMIPPLEYGSFFRHNLLSYREEDFNIQDYNMLFEFMEIIPHLLEYEEED